MYDTSINPHKKKLDLKTIVIDVDDVLIDIDQLHTDALMYLMPTYCANWHDISPNSFKTEKYANLSGRDLIYELNKDGYITSSLLIEGICNYTIDNITKYAIPDPEIESYLRTLSKYTAIYIASNRSQNTVMRILENMNIMGCFTGVMTPERYGKKQTGEMYSAIHLLCNSPLDSILVIEGSKQFSQQASRLGFKSIISSRALLRSHLVLIMDFLNINISNVEHKII